MIPCILHIACIILGKKIHMGIFISIITCSAMSSGRKSRRPPEIEAVEPCGVTPTSGSGDPPATDLPVSYVEDINDNLVTCICIENVRVAVFHYRVFTQMLFLRRKKGESPSQQV